MATNGSRNRTAGHLWELECVKALSTFYPGVATSRSCNRQRDAQKVDLAYPDEAKMGRFPYNVQSKNYSTSLPYPKLLAEMPQEEGIINVVLHKQTQKSDSGKFMPRGKYAILNMDAFLKLVVFRKAYEILITYIDFVPDEERVELDKKLKALGL